MKNHSIIEVKEQPYFLIAKCNKKVLVIMDKKDESNKKYILLLGRI